MEPRELSRRPIDRGRFLELEAIHWQGADGVERVWETAERVGRCEAVMIIPWLKPANRLVLIRQYRPPLDAEIIEFPAGILDLDGEGPEATALRELREETGYHGQVRSLTPPTFNTPGMTSESVYQVMIDIDDAKPENQNPIAEPEDGEHIDVITVARNELGEFLHQGFRDGLRFDSKVVAYIQGILHAPVD